MVGLYPVRAIPIPDMKAIISVLAGSVAVLSPLPAAETPAYKPNIVFILSDDQGIDGVGCYGSDNFKTPNIDKLAAGGIRFENAYCTPLCGPTRCLLTTGRYGFRTGGMSNQTAGNPKAAEEPALARALKQAGYATCHVGKWRQMGGSPMDWGFDESVTDQTAGGWYWQKSYIKNRETVRVDSEVYCPDVYHKFALDFIDKNKDKPFFLYYASHLVHGPIVRTPDSKKDGNTYAENVAYLDKQVGDVVAHLEKLGLREKTLILFASDNGTARQSRTVNGRGLSGSKGSMWEGGSHVPFIASWQGVTPVGKTSKALVDFSDLFPTFVEAAGAKMPDGVTFDGKSFLPILKGEAGVPREWVFVQLGAKWFVRESKWKLDQSGNLYDMTDAPYVEKAVAAEAADADSKAARQRLGAVLAKLNPAGGKSEPPGKGKMTNKKRQRKLDQKTAAP